MTHDEAKSLAHQAEQDLATCNYGICCVWPEKRHKEEEYDIIIRVGLSIGAKEHCISTREDYGVFKLALELLSHFYIP